MKNKQRFKKGDLVFIESILFPDEFHQLAIFHHSIYGLYEPKELLGWWLCIGKNIHGGRSKNDYRLTLISKSSFI